MVPDQSPGMWMPLSAAVGVGLLIGLERERRKGEGPRRVSAGIRTFTLVALLGAAARTLGGDLGVATAFAATAALVCVAYFRSPVTDPGITTGTALLLTLALGALAMREPATAVSIGIMATVVLASRAAMHTFVRQTLTDSELRDGLILAAAALVLLPWIPDRYVGPYDAVNPRTTWTIVVLIMAIGMIGHVAQRLLGPGIGLAASGLASGFVSSIATVAAMGSRARQAPGEAVPALSGALWSCVATVLQLALVVTATSWAAARALAAPLLCAGLASIIVAGLSTWRHLRGPMHEATRSDRAFSIGKAVTLAVVVSVMTLLSSAMQSGFGAPGLILGVAIAGFADAHAAAASVASLVVSGRLPAQEAIAPILAAVTTNAVSKAVVAFTSGPPPFGLRIVAGLTVQIAAAWIGFALFAR